MTTAPGKRSLNCFFRSSWPFSFQGHTAQLTGELQFDRVLKELEETRNMKYVTTIERRAIKRGVEQGRLQTLHKMLVEALHLRCQNILDELLAALSKLSDLQQLKQYYRQAITAGSLEEFEHMLKAGDQG